jgi:hypothetical protein
MKVQSFCAIAVAAALAAGGAQAHHSGAMFASDKVVSLAGTVREFQWSNPHSWIQLTVPNAKGGTDEWSVELASPNVLSREGWKPTTVSAGEKLTISIHPMRDGSLGGSFITATLPDGTAIRTGSGSGGGAPSRPN